MQYSTEWLADKDLKDQRTMTIAAFSKCSYKRFTNRPIHLLNLKFRVTGPWETVSFVAVHKARYTPDTQQYMTGQTHEDTLTFMFTYIHTYG